MSLGLPAVASPQPSYVEAIEAHGGGFIASSPEEWERVLRTLAADVPVRIDRGERARRTVLERYSTPVVAQQYLDALERLTSAGSSTLEPDRMAVHAS
jgi:glycosyltransferase involved in cell wall biosynthesis